MQELPLGVADFPTIRRDNLLYVDKTAKLLALIQTGRRYFLARPRLFGKSLLISTLQAMFSGESTLFAGLAAEEFVKECAKHPYPVLCFDMSELNTKSAAKVESVLYELVSDFAKKYEVVLEDQELETRFSSLLENLAARFGQVVILVDEYDRPLLECHDNKDLAREITQVLYTFYRLFKVNGRHIRFLMLTGILDFTSTGVFDVLNNIEDISADVAYADLCGYTQYELEKYFFHFIDHAIKKENISVKEFLEKLCGTCQRYSFAGKIQVYTPFCILKAFKKNLALNI